MINTKEREEATKKLPKQLKKYLPEMEDLWKGSTSHWEYEDLIYRFYHRSFKVYRLQHQTLAIVKLLSKIDPKERARINDAFLQIVHEGTGKVFDLHHNGAWEYHTRPILEAFFHAKFFLEMAIKQAKDLDGEEIPMCIDSGLAALLHLYRIR